MNSKKRNLVLSRYEGEKIMIGDDIIVEVVRVSHKGPGRNQVRLMISAPEDVEVDREEIRERKIFTQCNYGQY